MKTLSKALLCVLLTSASVRLCSADVVVYSLSQQFTSTQAGGTQSDRQAGQLVLDLATTNAALVTWSTFGTLKGYFVQPATNYVLVPITGPGGSRLTALGPLPPGPSPSGPTQYLGSPMLGRNGHLKIGTNTFVNLPSLLTSSDTTVSYNLQDGSNNSLIRFTQRYVFLPAATQSANNHGQSLNDVLNALVQSLKAQGYVGP